MKILAIADRNPQLNFPEFIRENNIELVVTLGDLERHDLLGLSQVTHIPKIGVYGNHCSGNYMDELGIRNMHMTTWQFGGLTFGGFQGCVRYKENPGAIMYTQEEADELFQQLPPVDVLLCHCPPRGINDEEAVAHQGFEGELAYIDRVSPKLLLHGHTYPTDETVVHQYRNTKIEYVNKYKIIDSTPDTKRPESFGDWLLGIEDWMKLPVTDEAETIVRLANLIDLESILDRSRVFAYNMSVPSTEALHRLMELLDVVRSEINQYPDDMYRQTVRSQIGRKQLISGDYSLS